MGKRILLLTASIGSGHERAADAIEAELKKRFGDIEINRLDFTNIKTSWLNWLMKFIYLNMLRFVPELYEFIYRFTSGKRKGCFIQLLMALAMSGTARGLIDKYKPDIVICTHPFPTEAISYLSPKYREKFLSAAVITDYSVHQMWICAHINMYFVATDFMKEQLVIRGIAKENIFVSGIPIGHNFRQTWKRDEGIATMAKDLPTVLLMGGGLGLGRMERVLEDLEEVAFPIRLIVVTGKNKKLKKQVKKYQGNTKHFLENIGYTNEIDKLMLLADVLITKPGALTLTEAMAMELPMLLHEPIPGPETDNARFMSDCGVAIWLHAGDDLARVTEGLLLDKNKREKMIAAARKQSNPLGAKIVVDKIMENI